MALVFSGRPAKISNIKRQLSNSSDEKSFLFRLKSAIVMSGVKTRRSSRRASAGNKKSKAEEERQQKEEDDDVEVEATDSLDSLDDSEEDVDVGEVEERDEDDEEEDDQNEEGVVAQLIDIREPLLNLKRALERRLGVNLARHKFWLQDSQELPEDTSLVEQCVQGEGMVQINGK